MSLGEEILNAITAGVSSAAAAASNPNAAAAYPSGPHLPSSYPPVPPPSAPGSGVRYGRGGGGGGGREEGGVKLPVWMSDEMVQSLTNVLLELPFSRRAETEADLIGGWRRLLAVYITSNGLGNLTASDVCVSGGVIELFAVGASTS